MRPFRPTQALCLRCEVMRAVRPHVDPTGETTVADLAYFLEEHAGEPGGTRCLGSGARVVFPHEFIHAPEMRAA